MRRKDREVTDQNQIRTMIDQCKVMRLAMSVQNTPYVIPLNFGYQWEEGRPIFCFHGAKEGKKWDMIRVNPRVAFELDGGHALISGGDCPCEYGYGFFSVVGEGTAVAVADPEEKKTLLSRLMLHQTGRMFSFTDAQVESVFVCKIQVHYISAKAHME
jgi:nitroimidazol reductase NimA-like FMN-containing flavoprotein (pyridoxamine 5'-phosphate oxidase superfamily)